MPLVHPDFTLNGPRTSETAQPLPRCRGSGWVIYFYPKGRHRLVLTKEACGFRDQWARLRNSLGSKVLIKARTAPPATKKIHRQVHPAVHPAL